ncbi:uncharacterized protein L969DRAFT_86421 [Mixia osmundae IAM 14324]|uniref:Sulfotransferase domain-containing protein n=1 Tax=Mixia osmundae (strain CBS 9802 / IAM 14324 / JCM 22182 / KY 12970) TaxID=764103 RepID=G7E993_MIXOS|nr:uncharacterized protein L969DRAFT_86421 [Mixia osmundae IAM 14324]KEI39835.1 hypothetical protein L969DRAFT_86421 [Mixia osmundae IAM 14324]GAA99212.1 hypothetical protein E5Q_05905 [Mixia osmundae IAM 14324]
MATNGHPQSAHQNGSDSAAVNGHSDSVPNHTNDPKAIILWSHPRSTSTMFERMFLNRPNDFTVLHEPLGDSYYFGPERMSPRYSPAKCASDFPQHKDLTFAKQWEEIVNATVAEPGAPPKVFIKDMAQYIIPPPTVAPSCPKDQMSADENPTVIPTEILLNPNIAHTFLIRHPEKSVPSYYRLCSGDKMAITGFEYFDPEEVGLRESRMLHAFIRKRRGVGTPEPLVIDSADLIRNPNPIMERYCEHVGVPFSLDMLEWQSGQQEHFKKWVGFHDDAEQSTGIGKCSPRKDKPSTEEMPEIVKQAIQANIADYEHMRQFALQI